MLFDRDAVEFDRCLVEPRQARAVESIMQILEAAAQILVDDPALLSITAIAERSELPRATVYRYFDGVAPIVQTLAATYSERAVAAAVEATTNIDDPIELFGSVTALSALAVTTLKTDPLASALFIRGYDRQWLGRLVEESARSVLTAAVDRQHGLLAPSRRTRTQHIDRTSVLTAWFRLILEATLDDEQQRRDLLAAFTDLAFDAAEVDFGQIVRDVGTDTLPVVEVTLD